MTPDVQSSETKTSSFGEIKNFKQGFLFPIPIMLAGVLLLLGSVYLYYDEKWMGFVAAIIIGSVLSFSSEGIEISKKNHTYNEWTRWFGIRFGKPKSLEIISSVSVILETDSGKFYPVTEQAPAKTDDYYKVFLMTDNHLHKIFIAKFREKKKAFQLAEDISVWLGMEVKTYSPQRYSRAQR